MTVTQQRKILQRIAEIESDIDTIRRVRLEVASTGYASASMSSSGGAKSYTHQDLGKLSEILSELQVELRKYRALLSGSTSAIPATIYTVYS